MVVCCDILLTMFMQERFWCLILCNKVMAKKDFFNGTYVSYTRWNVQWASISILLLLRNNKVSLARTLHTYDGNFFKVFVFTIDFKPNQQTISTK